ncbi:pilus assembly protein [Roseovarius sp. TE539]|uniref:TadE/TadG family type IV pilus assembly protein n=1 Tax=Roseovarius sp. TE539 TaxID=2249812 RepID=UPI000DE0AD51|nr:TadE/TadG family type IV pilus assembly protein [Roseovarius sp. TE539]RBI72362.1 pilus assembly protein [Roseovarius sp. TE539]
MIARIRKMFSRLWGDEDGSFAMEFMLIFPVYLALLGMSLELSLITLRHTMLERGLDIAVRDIRLGTGTAPKHDEIKATICDQTLIIANCNKNLRLEMMPTDIRSLGGLPDGTDCTDQEEPTKPVRQFTPGQQNQLMLLRACVKYDPLFPTWRLGRALDTDSSGQAAIVSMTAFVQEPL